jgi:hypothetical protein
MQRATVPDQDAGAVGGTADSGRPTAQADSAGGGAQPSVDEIVDRVLSRLQLQLVLDHERTGGFLPNLMH